MEEPGAEPWAARDLVGSAAGVIIFVGSYLSLPNSARYATPKNTANQSRLPKYPGHVPCLPFLLIVVQLTKFVLEHSLLRLLGSEGYGLDFWNLDSASRAKHVNSDSPATGDKGSCIQQIPEYCNRSGCIQLSLTNVTQVKNIVLL